MAGLVVGFLALGVFWIITLGMIIQDEIKRHKEYNKMYADQVATMKREYRYDFADKDNMDKYKKWKASKVL